MELLQYEVMTIIALAVLLSVLAFEIVRMDRDLRQKEHELELYKTKYGKLDKDEEIIKGGHSWAV